MERYSIGGYGEITEHQVNELAALTQVPEWATFEEWAERSRQQMALEMLESDETELRAKGQSDTLYWMMTFKELVGNLANELNLKKVEKTS